MVNGQSAEIGALVSRADAEEAFRRAMALFVGRGRRYSVAQLAKGSGVPARMIECFRAYQHGHPDYRKLDLGQMLSIAAILGAAFTSEWLKLAGQAAYDLPDGSDGDLDDAGLDAGEAAHAVQRARHPNSPGGIAIVPQERAEIIPLLRKSVASGRRAMG